MKVGNEIFFAAVEEQIAEGMQVKITLVGTSMQPTLCEGDILTLAPLDGHPAVGDVVLFRYQGQHLLHRIISVADGIYTMQGDNCVSTESCRRDAIVARLVAVEKHHHVKRFVLRWFGHRGRTQLRPWYFGLLAILMWAPLNGLGVPLDNYIFGLRADHLLHASVYLLCPVWAAGSARAAMGSVGHSRRRGLADRKCAIPPPLSRLRRQRPRRQHPRRHPRLAGNTHRPTL